MIKDLTIGQFFDTASLVHKLDPRIKIVLLIALLVLIFCASNLFSLAALTVLILFVLLLTKVPFSVYLKNLKIIVPILIITMLLNVFYIKEGTVLLEFWKITITTGGVIRSVFMGMRVVLLIITSSVLTYTTTPNDLTDAIERLLLPLKLIGLGGAVHAMSMMMTIALRFIPTLVEETDKIMNAQKARGADFETGKLTDRVKAIIPILIPLLISSVRRAYDLAEAMESRCYNGGVGKTRMKVLKISKMDVWAIIFVVISFAFVLSINNFLKV